ncbi:MAG: hypothetical protein QOG65_3575, partial [Actinomycetota bacterium]|nr:hypothetical protein [Actinomycetota bacterium]
MHEQRRPAPVSVHTSGPLPAGRGRNSGVDAALGKRFGLPRSQLEDRLGVDLADPALGDAEDIAYLVEGQALVVVEREHEALAVGHPVDRVGQDLTHLLGFEGLDRI